MINRVILDANLLVVYVIGVKHPERLGDHRRVKEYLPSDFTVLTMILSHFNQIVLTPNVITECSDLLGDGESDSDAKEALKALIHSPEVRVIEEYVPSKDASTRNQYKYLGIADCALLELIDDDTILLSADSQLVSEAQSINPNSINFNHYRDFLSPEALIASSYHN